MRFYHFLTVRLSAICLSAACITAVSAAPPSAPVIAAQALMDRAHHAKGLAELNGLITNNSAADSGLGLVFADAIISGLGSSGSSKGSHQGASERAFQDKLVSLLKRYSLTAESLKDSSKSGVLPPTLQTHGHQFLADMLALDAAYDKSQSVAEGDSLSSETVILPAAAVCRFQVLSPTRVKIVPLSKPQSFIEARLEGDAWRLELDAGGSLLPGPKIGTITPAAAALLHDIDRRDTDAVQRKLKSDPALANAPAAFFHGNTGSISPLPLSETAFNNDPKTAAVLIRAGANVNAEDEFGETALDQAARFGSPPVAAMLLAHGAKIDHRDSLGKTTLHQAVESDSPATVALLLSHGAAVNARDAQGKTPLATALASRSDKSADHATIVKMLRLHGGK